MENSVGRAARHASLKRSMQHLGELAGTGGDVVLAGDFNWDDQRDGPLPLKLAELAEEGMGQWQDAWLVVRPLEVLGGFTYDGAENGMLTNTGVRKRLDRVIMRGGGRYRVQSVERVLRDPIEDLEGQPLTYIKRHEGKLKKLKVHPSDHYGLVATLRRKDLPERRERSVSPSNRHPDTP
mmetsp:Transcript_10007/g.32452  ORF Transcript_10007/g.32452 Transcript_10007/m.32452 type:complete len:180 (-) Transcript_10007:122-661(-)